MGGGGWPRWQRSQRERGTVGQEVRGSTGAKGAGAMGLMLRGQMGVWALGKMPGRKALGWAHRRSAGRKGRVGESQGPEGKGGDTHWRTS